MKSLIVLFGLLNFGSLYAQKHKTPKSEQIEFTHSYRMEAKDFERYVLYAVVITDWNADSVIINLSCDSTQISGTISYDYNLKSGITYTADGNFHVIMAKKGFKGTLLNLILEFEGYDITIEHIELSEYPDGPFFITLNACTIFDPETPYIIINSVDPLSIEEQKALINCMALNKSAF